MNSFTQIRIENRKSFCKKILLHYSRNNLTILHKMFQESPQKSEDSSSLQQIGALAIFAGFIWKLNSFLDAENRGREPVVDTWRGINVAFMVFVNYGGGGYWWLQHSPWDGITLADLVMPSFLSLNGISIALRKKSTKRRNLKRFVKTFFLGLIVSNKGKLLSLNFDFANWRIPGVLQRIAICELIVSVLSFSNFALLTGVLLFYFLWLSIYFLATPFDLPSCPASYNGPGGISSNSQFFHCIGGSSGAIDRFFLGNSHLYQWSTAKGVFYPEEHFKNQPIVFDPEGITGTFSSILTVFIGFVAGKILRKKKSFQRRMFLLGIGSILIFIGLNRASTVPFNKNLWSDSFVFFTAGFNFLALLFVLDFSFPVFARLGRRSMFVYVGHTFLRGYFPFSWNSSLPPTHASIFSENLFATCLWLVLGNIFESFSLRLKN